jgi:hypothetical protein
VTESEPRWERVWPEFSERLKAKLAKGYEEHSDWSFGIMPEVLLEEIVEEVLDICGWSLVLYSRLRAIEPVIDDLRGGNRHGHGQGV